MLETLDSTPWAKLSHAYGKGADLPDHLRALLSADKKKRAKALFQIGASICHQGSMYSATAPATKMLVALVGSNKTPDRGAILQLLGAIATLDDDGPFLLHGMPASLKVPKACLVNVAMTTILDLDVSYSAAAAVELLWAGAPRCKAEIAAEAKKLQKSGVPKRKDGENLYLFPMCLVAVAVGAAKIALTEKKDAPPWVDEFLQEVYGFDPRVRDALAALPIARREKWVFHERRDDRDQPAESFKGAWPYFMAVPTTRVADRALKHVQGWKDKDVWGGSRKKYADPLLAEFAKALRDAGNTADAARCEAALAALP